jgi:uncharacterized damage-inducible protein DinB
MADTSSQEQAAHFERARQHLADTWEQETATTLRVMRAYPPDKLDLKPHERSNTARSLAWLFNNEMRLVQQSLAGALDFALFQAPAPDTLDEIISHFEKNRTAMLDAIRNASDEQMGGTTKFFVAPKTMGDIPNEAFLWFLLHDQIHHRGQFSVYLRMAGGKLPSIYGPTADEPWN